MLLFGLRFQTFLFVIMPLYSFILSQQKLLFLYIYIRKKLLLGDHLSLLASGLVEHPLNVKKISLEQLYYIIKAFFWAIWGEQNTHFPRQTKMLRYFTYLFLLVFMTMTAVIITLSSKIMLSFLPYH